MNLSLSSKNAIIGGSSRGIGLAAAIELAELGANCTLMSRNEDALKEAVNKLSTSAGNSHDYLVVDNSDIAAFENAVKAKTGEKNYHILVNNTGGPPGGPLVNASTEEFMNAINAHLICNHILVQAVIEGMKKDGLWKDNQCYFNIRKSPFERIRSFKYNQRSGCKLGKDIGRRTGRIRYHG